MENQPAPPTTPPTPTPQPQIPATQQRPITQPNNINQTQTGSTETDKPKSKGEGMKNYLKLNYILGVIVLFLGLSKLLAPIVLLNLVGIIYYVITTIALFKKPKIGYALLVVLILGQVLVYAIYYYASSY